MTIPRNFFRKGIAAKSSIVSKPKRPPRIRNHPRPTVVQILTADGRLRIVGSSFARFQMLNANRGIVSYATGAGARFDSTSGRKAVQKRWAKHPQTRLGIRKGARLVRRSPVSRGPLRERYSLSPCRGIQYSPALKVWTITDQHNTRPITERTALRKLGHIPYPDDKIRPIQIVKGVQFDRD